MAKKYTPEMAKEIPQDMAQDMVQDMTQDIVHEKILEKAEIMLNDGLDIDLVSKYTGVSVEELNSLKK